MLALVKTYLGEDAIGLLDRARYFGPPATNGITLVDAIAAAIGRLEEDGHFGPFAVALGQRFISGRANADGAPNSRHPARSNNSVVARRIAAFDRRRSPTMRVLWSRSVVSLSNLSSPPTSPFSSCRSPRPELRFSGVRESGPAHQGATCNCAASPPQRRRHLQGREDVREALEQGRNRRQEAGGEHGRGGRPHR